MKKTYVFIVFVLMITALFLVACQPTGLNQTANKTNISIKTNKTVTPPPQTTDKNVSATVNGVEGDLITLKPKAYDPDNDKITYYFSTPFNKDGLWQTKEGDVGKYLVTVTASDGKLNTTAYILVNIKASDKAPVIECADKITVKEGDLINLKCNIYDVDDEFKTLKIEYSGWMNSPTFQTNFDSAGEHTVVVKASDKSKTTSKTITIIVNNVDRAPVFSTHFKDITVQETDIVTLKANATDPDKGDKVAIQYSDPFDKNGVWKTKIGDAGVYTMNVVASDGELNTKETFKLTVKMLNTAPSLKAIANMTVYEGEVVTIPTNAFDREGDKLTITYKGWITSQSYTTTYDDANPKGCNTRGCSALYKVTVTVSDGFLSTSQDVYVTVIDRNRPPVFVWP